MCRRTSSEPAVVRTAEVSDRGDGELRDGFDWREQGSSLASGMMDNRFLMHG